MTLTKEDLPTPALLLDLDIFQANLEKMARHVRRHGKSFRPHAKTHKCIQVAQRQIEIGALGVCVATVPEAEVMVQGDVRGVLLTSPLGTADKVGRMAQLAGKDPGLMVVVDHPRHVERYQEAAQAAGRTMNVLVDIDVGDRRTGALPGEPVLDLALAVDRSSNLKFKGFQAYSGSSSHTVGFEDRKAHSHKALAPVLEMREQLVAQGVPVEIFSGGSTGTYNMDIDADLDGLTELQAGSFIYMDIDYHRIGGRESQGYEDFGFALTVLSSVVSVNHADQVTLDAGLKAFSTDRSFGPRARDLSGVEYRWKGDEFGVLMLTCPDREIGLGSRLEFIVPHCDPTVNLYDRVHACRGEEVVEIWPIMNRLGSP